MRFLYTIVLWIVQLFLPVAGLFSDKMKLFVQGRKRVFKVLQDNISPTDRVIWIHAASLGEYEQAVPIIHGLRRDMPHHKILMTFFSPSGYEVKKHSDLVDLVTYLPLDTPGNARRFLDLAHPEMSLFIKYEFWPNLLAALHDRGVFTLLVSGAFRQDQIFFRSYGKWMQQYLSTFHHFFLQNASSERLLHSIGFTNTSISGDTRFDRVARQLQMNNSLPFIKDFTAGETTVVIGSSWPEDEALLIPFINKDTTSTKYIIAPHTIQPARIAEIVNALEVPAVRYSQKTEKDLWVHKVFIVDTIGLLSKIYSYAHIAYVGGAAGTTGLHNILEPATFAVPIIIGKNYDKFPEAIDLRKKGGLFAVSNREELERILSRLLSSPSYRAEIGNITGDFIQKNTGATKIISEYIQEHHLEGKR